MAKNFLEGVDLKSQNTRNGFDVSYQNQFTAPFGMMLPFFFQRVNPDDKIKLSNETQTICDGLVKPAFMRLREHLDYYFIPATQLWMPFDNFITGQNSYFSSAVSDVNSGDIPGSAPTFTLGCLDAAFPGWVNYELFDDLGYNFGFGAARLLDMLGYCNLTDLVLNDFSEFDRLGWLNNNTRFNFFPLLCYQKVYYDYFRNPKYEDNDVEAYNIDYLESGRIVTNPNDIGATKFRKFFKIHYRWQKKDYFTQTQNNILPQADDIGYSGLTSSISTSNLFNIPGYISRIAAVNDGTMSNNQGRYVKTGGLSGQSGSATAANFQDNGVSVANIRFAFAYDKLLRRMREAGPDFDRQMLAQFGITPYDARHGKCHYIGGYTNALSSSDVTNMTGSGIGELAGQINAYSDNSSKILNFHAKEHGYIIGIYSTSVDNLYQSYRFNRECLLRDRFDWFNPAFENLGLSPIFKGERDYTAFDDDDEHSGASYNPSCMSEIIGYVPRYSELKTHIDECHGMLCKYTNVVGYREWNVQVNDQYTNNVLSKSSMLLAPSQFNAVSGVDYNGKPNTDHFIVNTYNHSHKVSSMSMFEDF